MKALTAITIAVGVLVSSLSQAASLTQFSVEKSLPVTDLGLAPQNEVRSIVLSLTVKDLAGMQAYAAATVDPTSPNYRKFLTPAQVGAKFGQDAATVTSVVNFLKSQGLTVVKVYSNNLLISVKGSNAQLASVFGSPIHTYQSAVQTYEAPVSSSAIPAQLSGIVQGVHGLSTHSLARSNAKQVPSTGTLAGDVVTPTKLPTRNAVATGTPGSFTVGDLANMYNVNPLYQAGITGAGKTIGIMSLAGYNQSDAYFYWNNVGLTVDPARITDVLVDGGPLANDGPGSEGAGETTLDVQQSGGVAPGAKMRVYLAPNTDGGFLDAFAQPVEENLVDTLSISWGAPEIYNDGATLNAFRTVFLQAAIQGIPIIAAAGDAGSYDINRSYTYPDCTLQLTVDYPAADPYVLAAGGTTVPNTVVHKYGPVTVTQERAWSWDYLRAYITQYYGQTLFYSDYYTVGGGGGVSVDFARPDYQGGLTGVATSANAQSLYCKGSFIGKSANTYYDLADLPGSVAGRNLPDVSLNADPYSGYLLYVNGNYASEGGTSFVAPQLNGIFTLIAAGANGRLGQLQPQLYSAFKQYGYGSGSPFRPIAAGTNGYYPAKASYNPATGLGTLDVTNLARAFGVQL